MKEERKQKLMALAEQLTKEMEEKVADLGKKLFDEFVKKNRK